MKWKIYYASGIGGDRVDMKDGPDEIEEFSTRDEAIKYAWEKACEEYDNYAGLHGIRDVDEIMDEEGVDEDEAWEIYREERENSVDYDAKPVVNKKKNV